MAQPYQTAEETYSAFADTVSPGKVAFFRAMGVDLVMGERGGATFTDAYTGRRYWNCHCNGGVFNLGHRNPKILATLRAALDEVDVGNHHLVSGWRAKLGERLAATTGGALGKVVFTTSGSEAVDCAVKAARGTTGRTKVISIAGAWHGNTGLAVAASDPSYRQPFGADLPGFVQVPFDDLDAIVEVIDEETAAVLLEPVPATLGMPVASPGYFPAVAESCRRHGAKLLLDEVQTGLGRSGRFWAYEHLDVVPDAVITGKGLSGGFFPMGAVLMTEDLFRPFLEAPFAHFSTFGGADLGCAAVLAVLDEIEADGFLGHVRALSDRFRSGFEDAPFRMRGLGLMAALKLEKEGAGLMATKALIDAGVFVVFANNESAAIQFLPPLILSDVEADEIISVVRTALG
jgi:acetylornithine/succinyldiaminopimelate/putrescine aminotransferase